MSSFPHGAFLFTKDVTAFLMVSTECAEVQNELCSNELLSVTMIYCLILHIVYTSIKDSMTHLEALQISMKILLTLEEYCDSFRTIIL